MNEDPSEILRDLLEIARDLIDGPPGDEGECWYCGGALDAIPGCPWHGEDSNCFGFMFDGDHDDDCMMVALRDTVGRHDAAEHELHQWIDDLVDRWHEGASGLQLHEFLGMTREEYGRWGADDRAVPESLRQRYRREVLK